MKHIMRKGVTGILVVAALLAAMLAPAAVLADDAPLLPHAFGGTLHVNGDPAPAGTTVTGIILDAIGTPGEGSLVTTEEGVYGTAGARLSVSTNNGEDEGKTIEFLVQEPGWAEAVKADQTAIYVIGGGPDTVNLTVTAGPQSAVIDPAAASYDLFAPGEVVTTVTWNDATAVTGINDGAADLVADTDYAVVDNTLTILASYFAGQDPALAVDDEITLTISFDAGEAVTLTVTVTDTTPTGAVIDPSVASYDLFAPGDVTATVTWNDATAITGINDGAADLVADTDYTVTDIDGDTATLTILAAYFAGKDPALVADDIITSTISFDVGEAATLTITAVDTTPPVVSAAIDPAVADYDLFAPGDVTTTVTWNDATAITGINDGAADLVADTAYTIVDNTLTILEAYFAGLESVVDDVVALTISFDAGAATTLTVTVVDTTPPVVSAVIDPAAANYDLFAPGDVTTTITWNDASTITGINDGAVNLAADTDYTIVEDTLTILAAYFAGQDPARAVDDEITLTISFDTGEDATLTVTVIDTTPAVVSAVIDPAAASYDLFAPGDVAATVTWNDASTITGINDGAVNLTADTDYTIVEDTLTILAAYFAGQDPALAVYDVVTLTISFDTGEDATLTVTVIDTTPAVVSAVIDPAAASYDLFAPGDVAATVTWNDASVITGINDGAVNLTADTDYTIVEDTLTILAAYFAGQDPALAVDDVVTLTISFDTGEDATLTVTVIDTTPISATISPETGNYDLYAPADVVTTITWNDAEEITSISDGTSDLTAGADYTIAGNTLSLLDAYFVGLDPEMDDVITLTISFDVGEDAVLTVTVIDTTPELAFGFSIISPQVAGTPFSVTVTAYQEGELDVDYSGTASLTSNGELSPAVIGPFAGGVWTGNVTIGNAGLGITINATDGERTGTSQAFSVYDRLLCLDEGWSILSTDKWIDADSSAFEGSASLVYRHTADGYIEATLDDLEPVEAFFVKMEETGEAGLAYSNAVVPGVSSKQLSEGWNLISCASADIASAILSPLRYVQVGQQQGIALTTLVSQGNYNYSEIGFYLATVTDSDWETLSSTTLNPFDGYWIYLNGTKQFGVIPQ